MVTLRSAKPPCAGSIPALDSINKKDIFVNNNILCWDGGIGRHEGLKLPCPLKACGFKSRSQHKENRSSERFSTAGSDAGFVSTDPLCGLEAVVAIL